MTDAERNSRKYKKELENLTNAVSKFLSHLDVEMKRPSDFERGKRIAQLSNDLDMANDGALHFTLERSFQSIGHRKDKMSRLASGEKASTAPER